MPKFSANLSMLYSEWPFLERFAMAAADGFQAVEYLRPYDETPEAICEQLERHDLVQALFNLPAGDWAAGERGIACMPDRVEEFKPGVEVAIRYAQALKCSKINCLAGIAPTDASAAVLEVTLISNLSHAAARLRDVGIDLLIEPINLRDIPGFFVSTTDHAERIIDAVGADNLFIQYDLYHTQIMQGDLICGYERLRERIGHIQLADTPGRHEPGTGEINFANVLPALDSLGYGGFVGCEYKPLAGTREGLIWMKPYLQGGVGE
ncbi:hydroxypyruvate isomerase [Chelativorans oligotrophicus]|uniref:hydroxypyruvate isomerase n=1 Tax=Chelativorans oligotrophicus TaxID=449974 RepID=UPI00140B2B9A|nr:hydroxypyruvate isomerase [Chelativorans oligotrophicus]